MREGDCPVNEKKPSIWQKEITIPWRAVTEKLPAGTEEWLALTAVGLFILAPAVMSVLAMAHRSIDYTVFVHPRLIRNYIYPFSAVLSALTMILSAARRKAAGERPRDFFRRNPVYLFFALLLIWMLISQTVNGWGLYAFLGALTREETIFMQLGYFCLLFPGAALVRDERKKRSLLRLHMFVSYFLAAAANILWHSQTESVIFNNWSPVFSSIYTSTNYYGYYLATVIPIAAVLLSAEKHWGWKLFSGLTLAVNGAALSMNSTMGAWVACAATFIFLLIARFIIERKPDWWILLGAVIVAVMLWLPDRIIGTANVQVNTSQLASDVTAIAVQAENAGSAGSGRWRIWQGTVSLIGQKPLLGWGMEAIYAHDLTSITVSTRPHNEYLQYALFYGIPAALLYFTGCFSVFLQDLRLKVRLDAMTFACLGAAFSYLVSAFFGNTIYCTAPFLFLFLGMGLVRDP